MEDRAAGMGAVIAIGVVELSNLGKLLIVRV